ncbi:hypothetical protein Taro_021157 [Colocasia esculenta]|uniref:Uncharacterized protein n=1 Tax=Colocasia esculenta TaxID=4460 RepID=A0A843V7C8_COLES|nr:hypothetical protein [Colocasia esculenta]
MSLRHLPVVVVGLVLTGCEVWLRYIAWLPCVLVRFPKTVCCCPGEGFSQDCFALVSVVAVLPQSLMCAVGLAGAFWRVFPKQCLGGSSGGSPQTCLRSSQDSPLSLLVEVLPRSALCLFQATVVLPMWFEVCRLVGLHSVTLVGLRVPVAHMICFVSRALRALPDGCLRAGAGVACCALSGLQFLACGFWQTSGEGSSRCIALYLGWLLVLVIAPCVVSGSPIGVPYFGLGPSEVDVLSSISAVVSVPVWLCVFLVVGMLVPALSPYARGCDANSSLILRLLDHMVCRRCEVSGFGLTSDVFRIFVAVCHVVERVTPSFCGSACIWYPCRTTRKALASYPFPLSLLFFPFPSSPLMGRLPSSDPGVDLPAARGGAWERHRATRRRWPCVVKALRGTWAALGFRIPAICVSTDVATARRVVTPEEASAQVPVVTCCPDAIGLSRRVCMSRQGSCHDVLPLRNSVAVAVPRPAWDTEDGQSSTRCRLVSPLSHCLSLRWFRSHVVVSGVRPQLGQAVVLHVLCVFVAALSRPCTGTEARARLASRACGLRVPLLAASGGGLVVVVVTTFPSVIHLPSLHGGYSLVVPSFHGRRWSGLVETHASCGSCFGVLSVPWSCSWVPARDGTGVCSFPTLRYVWGPGWFYLWALNLVEV